MAILHSVLFAFNYYGPDVCGLDFTSIYMSLMDFFLEQHKGGLLGNSVNWRWIQKAEMMFTMMTTELTSKSTPSTFSGPKEDMRLPKLFSLQLLFMRRLQNSGLQKRWEIGKWGICHNYSSYKWNIFKGHQVHTLLAN